MRLSHQTSIASKSSVRKPLRDISKNHTNKNDVTSLVKSVNAKKTSIPDKKIAKRKSIVRVQEQEEREESSLDRLLLVHSDISCVTRQIDELVAQAFKLKATSEGGSEEIESLTHALSSILSSLQPWVPRLQKVLSSHFVEPENQMQNKSASDIDEDGSFDIDSPEQTKMDSLISPSPLVSWRADHNVERGRQLFLLTPLPISKSLSSRKQEFPQSVFERVALDPAVDLPSIFTISGDGTEDLLEDIAAKPVPSKPADSVAAEGKSTLGCFSSPVFLRRNPSVVMTPCLKMSPPKSCLLLEPMSQSSHKGNNRVRKSTPFPVGVLSRISESSGSEGLEDLALKYPELLGIRRDYKCRTGIRDLEACPSWCFSPPKTCIVLEPPVEKPLDIDAAGHQLKVHPSVLNQQKNLTPSKECDVRGGCRQLNKPCNGEPICRSLKPIKCTPLWKEPESTVRTGKRPGENTLKKELWTKFEAASTYGLRLNASAFQGTKQKGFLDMLDEVSCDEESPAAVNLR